MAITLATYGGLTQAVGFPGQLAEAGPHTIRSFINESATAIDFGRAVCRGTATAAGATDLCKPVGVDGDIIIGISIRDAALLTANSSGEVTYAQRMAVPVMESGVVFVTAAEAVAEGTGALSLTAGVGTIGGVSNGAAGAGRVVIPGAIWLDTTASGAIGRVRIKNSTT